MVKEEHCRSVKKGKRMKHIIDELKSQEKTVIGLCFSRHEAQWIEGELEIPSYRFVDLLDHYEDGSIHIDHTTVLLLSDTYTSLPSSLVARFSLLRCDTQCNVISYSFHELLSEPTE